MRRRNATAMRFFVVVGLAALAASVAASAAAAFGFTDDTRTLPNATLGSHYQGDLRARNGCPPYTFRAVDGAVLPPGLALTADGHVVGTPTTQGRWQFWLAVDDSCHDESQWEFSIDVSAPPPPAES